MASTSSALIIEGSVIRYSPAPFSPFRFTVTDRVMNEIASRLQSGTFTELDLSSCVVYEPEVRQLGEILQTKECKIQSLKLKGSVFCLRGVVAVFFEVLKSEHCALTMLNLNGVALDRKEFQVLLSALKSEHCKLTTLVLSRGSLLDVQDCLVEAVKENKTLTTLRVKRCGINSRNLTLISSYLQRNRQELCLQTTK